MLEVNTEIQRSEFMTCGLFEVNTEIQRCKFMWSL